MSALRRRIASCALALALIQLASVFTVPVLAQCASEPAPHAAAAPHCCPAGSHAPGQCPLHHSTAPQQESSGCRMICSHHEPTGFVPGLVAVPPHTIAIDAVLVAERRPSPAAPVPASLTRELPSPPPKSRS